VWRVVRRARFRTLCDFCKYQFHIFAHPIIVATHICRNRRSTSAFDKALDEDLKVVLSYVHFLPREASEAATLQANRFIKNKGVVKCMR
jgi:hypothetical protein